MPPCWFASSKPTANPTLNQAVILEFSSPPGEESARHARLEAKNCDVITPSESIRMNANRLSGEGYRPACMQQLGLLPPYSMEDVKRAYRNLAKSSHPDAGGSAEEFARLHEAYERALSLAGFHESRRSWLAARIERYAERQEFEALLSSFGGRCLVQRPEIYLADFGPDFGQMLCEVTAVYLTQSECANEALRTIAVHPVFQEARLLDLSFSSVTDDALPCLSGMPLLGLDLRRTRVTSRGLKHVSQLPDLEWLHIGQTRIGFFSRFRWRQSHPEIDVMLDADADQPDYDSLGYRQSQLMQRLATVQR